MGTINGTSWKWKLESVTWTYQLNNIFTFYSVYCRLCLTQCSSDTSTVWLARQQHPLHQYYGIRASFSALLLEWLPMLFLHNFQLFLYFYRFLWFTVLVPFTSGTHSHTEAQRAKLFSQQNEMQSVNFFVNGFAVATGWTSSTVINCFLHFFCCLSVHSYRHSHLWLWSRCARFHAPIHSILFFSL